MKVECNEVPVIMLPEGFEHEATQVNEENKWGLMFRLRPLHEKLGFEPSRTEKEVYHNLRPGTEASIIKKLGDTPEDNEDAAFVIQNILEDLDIRGRQMIVLSIATKVVSPEYQRLQFGTFLSQEAILRHNPNVVTGRTRNPNAIRAYQKTGLIDEILPIDKLYPHTTQIELAVFYGRLSSVFDGKDVYGDDHVDLRTGLCRGVYPRGASTQFLVDELSPKARKIYDRMVSPEIGANLEEGDGIRYWAVVNSERIMEFPYSGPGTEVVIPAAKQAA